jgi:hypothetical protein
LRPRGASNATRSIGGVKWTSEALPRYPQTGGHGVGVTSIHAKTDRLRAPE